MEKQTQKMHKKIIPLVKTFFASVVMSIASIIPGFSGGVALTFTGEIHSVWGKWKDIVHPKKHGDRAAAIIYYLFFLLGSLAGSLGFAQVVRLAVDNIPAPTFIFFVVISIASIFIFHKLNAKDLNNNITPIWKKILFLGIGILIIGALMTYLLIKQGPISLSFFQKDSGSIELSDVNKIILICVAGFFSSFAMVTPGMSSALIILVFGVYAEIYAGILGDILDHFLLFFIYSLSTVIGVVFAIYILGTLYEKFRDVLSWLFWGTIFMSIIAMVTIFYDVMVPRDNITWLYMSISLVIAVCLGYVVYRFSKASQ